MKSKVIISILTVLLLTAEVIVVLISWIGSVLMPEMGISSLLSSEGVRWFVGSFSTVVSTPLLVNMLLIGMTVGMIMASGIVDGIRLFITDTDTAAQTSEVSDTAFTRYTERLALQAAVVLNVIFVVVVLMLTFLPHAVLLNADGDILNSSISRGFIPVVCFGLSLSSAVYGLITSRLSLKHSFAQAFARGISIIAPYILIYILSAQLYFTVAYVLNL